MKRGDIVRTVGRGDFSNKPRPSLVVQADSFNEYHPSVTVCPITSSLSGDSFYRILVTADGGNGLTRDSEIEIDRVQAIWRERTCDVIGQASDEVMFAVDQAIRRWLAL